MTPIVTEKNPPLTLADLEDADITNVENPSGYISNGILCVIRTPVYINQSIVDTWTTPEQKIADIEMKGQFTVEVALFWKKRDGKIYSCPKATLKGLTDAWELLGGHNLEGIKGIFSNEITKSGKDATATKVQLNFSIAAMDPEKIAEFENKYTAYIGKTPRRHNQVIGKKGWDKDEQYGAQTSTAAAGTTTSRNTGAVSAAQKYDVTATQGITPPQG